jgi:hypothetical protein
MSGRRDFRHSTPQCLPSWSCADAETGGHLESRTDAGDLFSLLRGAGLVYQHDACRLSAVVRAALHHLPQREPKYRAAKPSPHLLYDAKPNALRLAKPPGNGTLLGYRLPNADRSSQRQLVLRPERRAQAGKSRLARSEGFLEAVLSDSPPQITQINTERNHFLGGYP